MSRLVTTCLGLALTTAPLAASELVDQLLAELATSLDRQALADTTSPAWPEAIAELVAEANDLGLEATDHNHLRLALAEAWLASQMPGPALAVLATLDPTTLDGPGHERWGLAHLAAWSLAGDGFAADGDPPPPADPVAALAALGEFPPPLVARAHALIARAGLRGDPASARAAIPAIDAGLDLLKEASPRERLPLYAQRVLAMERSGDEPQAIEAWLQNRRDDPAVAEVLRDLLTASARLVGRPAPPLAAPRLDGQVGVHGLGEVAGHPVLVFFFATWSRTSEAITPAVVRAAAAHPELRVIAVSLDTRDTAPRLAGWIERHGIGFPVVGQQLGWDSELDDAFHVEALPSLVLIDAGGTVAATDLAAENAANTTARIERALSTPGPAAAHPPPPGTPELP